MGINALEGGGPWLEDGEVTKKATAGQDDWVVWPGDGIAAVQIRTLMKRVKRYT